MESEQILVLILDQIRSIVDQVPVYFLYRLALVQQYK